MRFYNRLNFQKKLLIYILSIVIFIGGAMGLLIRYIIFPYLTKEMEARGTIIAHRLAESTRKYILTRDKVHLTSLIFDEKYLEENVSYIIVTDEANNVLAHTLINPDLLNKNRGKTSAGANQSNGEEFERNLVSEYVADIEVPVYEGIYQIGTIHVGLDKRFIKALIGRLTVYHLVFIGFITVVSLAFGFFLSRFITRPITSLTSLAWEISKGNMDIQINVSDRKDCWEVLDCHTTECPAFGNKKVRCWFIDYTLCKGTCSSRFPEKLEECKDCIVYKMLLGDEIVQLADSFNHMTERLRLSEIELRRSEEKYRFLFNNNPNPTFVISADSFQILDANDRALDTYGYNREKLIGMKFTDLCFSEDVAQIEKRFSNIIENHEVCGFLGRFRHRKIDGSILWVNVNCSYYRYHGQDVVIATATDITNLIETEAKLIQASKMTTLGEMSAGIAHELNQPLNAIKVGSEYLKVVAEQGGTISKQDFCEVAQEISAQVDRAANIINQLREFGRKSEISKEHVNVNEAIKNVFTLLGQQLKVHGIELVLELDEKIPPILADMNRIEQVLMNLVTNARDAIEEKATSTVQCHKGILTVKTYNVKDSVVIAVRDNGIGIPSSIKERVFEPFFTTKEVGKGTGLGLSISYGIVRDFGGDIDFESTYGNGTTFRIRFPRAPKGTDNG